ncbi:MAG TPA: hypothetical protein PKY59_25755 [Pyrinomonadaceae bacterium]|nr:hypothetical protein [Pyrinomonadaceae bacterium]
MSDISAVVGQFFQQGLENQGLKQQAETQTNGKRSFESYLQKNEPAQKVETQETQTTPEPKNQPKLDEIQSQLEAANQKYKQESGRLNEMLPDFLKTSRTSLIREAYNHNQGNQITSDNLQGRFEQVEKEYKDVEAIMRSDKNLSQGELLALQARMYQVGQHIEVMSKVVDQMAGGIKTVLNTNI